MVVKSVSIAEYILVYNIVVCILREHVLSYFLGLFVDKKQNLFHYVIFPDTRIHTLFNQVSLLQQ